MSEDIQRFHRWSRTYERSLGQIFLFGPVHKAVINLVEATLDGRLPENILDIGCGTGRLLRRAALRWPTARLIGVDPAEGMINEARRMTPSGTFHLGKGEAIPVPDSSVDAAFSTLSFHHWDDQAAGLREVARVLRPKGIFCLADGALPSLAGGLISHRRMHTSKEIAALFESAGLSLCSQRSVRFGGVLTTIGTREGMRS
ncbi:MAG: methyltransferase domain-containing protein [Spirochaetia bacterium]